MGSEIIPKLSSGTSHWEGCSRALFLLLDKALFHPFLSVESKLTKTCLNQLSALHNEPFTPVTSFRTVQNIHNNTALVLKSCCYTSVKVFENAVPWVNLHVNVLDSGHWKVKFVCLCCRAGVQSAPTGFPPLTRRKKEKCVQPLLLVPTAQP